MEAATTGPTGDLDRLNTVLTTIRTLDRGRCDMSMVQTSASAGDVAHGPLLPVRLDGRRAAQRRIFGVESGAAAGASLAEEIPASVELEVDLCHSLSVSIGCGPVGLQLEEAMFFVRQIVDGREHGSVVGHVVTPGIA
jgi:hypothetical protein